MPSALNPGRRVFTSLKFLNILTTDVLSLHTSTDWYLFCNLDPEYTRIDSAFFHVLWSSLLTSAADCISRLSDCWRSLKGPSLLQQGCTNSHTTAWARGPTYTAFNTFSLEWRSEHDDMDLSTETILLYTLQKSSSWKWCDECECFWWQLQAKPSRSLWCMVEPMQ